MDDQGKAVPVYHRRRVPGVSGGFGLAKTIKAASPKTKVLMITADVDHCLIKLFPIRDLVAAISTLLSSNAVAR